MAELFERLFSSLCLGNIFGVWLICTVVISIERGWRFAVASIGAYIVVLVLVVFAVWLFSLIESIGKRD